MQKIFHVFTNISGLIITLFLNLLFLSIISCTADGVWDMLNRQTETAEEIAEEIKDWKKRVKITIDNSGQGESFSDFPVLVKLNAGNISYSDFKPGGSDLTFYTAYLDERLDYEIDSWNVSGDSFIWVKIPSIPGGSSSGYFWLYYSSDVNTGTEDPDSVWSNNYRGVWHLDEAGSSYSDSSPYNNNGTGGTNGQTDSALFSGGVIGDAQDMSGLTDSIAVTSHSSINDLGPLTYSFWVYNSQPQEGDRLLSKDTFELWVSTNTKIRVDISYTGGLLQREFDCMPEDVWTYIAITWDGERDIPEIWLYSNGSAVAPESSANTSGSRNSDAGSDLFIGNDTYFAANNSKNCYLDEFRISGKVRSADWVNAQYLSQSGSYLIYSSAEDL